MNEIAAFKEKVRAVIEKHGGKVDIGIIEGVYQQPTELQQTHLPTKAYFAPIRIDFNGRDLYINTTSLVCTLQEAKEYLKRLQVAVNILDEINETITAKKEYVIRTAERIGNGYPEQHTVVPEISVSHKLAGKKVKVTIEPVSEETQQ